MSERKLMSERWERYLVTYPYAGATWSFHMMASSWEDAEARLKQLQYAKVVGNNIIEIPRWLGFLVPYICWFLAWRRDAR